MAVEGATPHAAPMAPHALANDLRSSSAALADGGNVLLTQAYYSRSPGHRLTPPTARTHEKAPTRGRGSSVEETRNQWAQPPALAGAPSVLKDDPQAQLLTAFGLLMAKPEPMSEST